MITLALSTQNIILIGFRNIKTDPVDFVEGKGSWNLCHANEIFPIWQSNSYWIYRLIWYPKCVEKSKIKYSHGYWSKNWSSTMNYHGKAVFV